MTTALFTHSVCLEHYTGYSHPESPARLQELLYRLSQPDFEALVRHEAPRAERAQLSLVHEPKYVSQVLFSVPETGTHDFAINTVMSPRTAEAALRAAGAVCAAVDAVMAGEVRNAFCAVRPPGHHAETGRAMGFCFFNNVAIGVAHARAVHGIKRAAVIDFDVHHGNGTQQIFKNQPDVFFVSTHQQNIFPNTGASTDRGIGNVLNLPLARGTDGKTYRQVFAEKVLPALAAAKPELIFISAGFDAHCDDPLGDLRLKNEDFAWITEILVEFAAQWCDGRIVSTLEGGYDPHAVAGASAAHIRALMAA